MTNGDLLTELENEDSDFSVDEEITDGLDTRELEERNKDFFRANTGQRFALQTDSGTVVGTLGELKENDAIVRANNHNEYALFEVDWNAGAWDDTWDAFRTGDKRYIKLWTANPYTMIFAGKEKDIPLQNIQQLRRNELVCVNGQICLVERFALDPDKLICRPIHRNGPESYSFPIQSIQRVLRVPLEMLSAKQQIEVQNLQSDKPEDPLSRDPTYWNALFKRRSHLDVVHRKESATPIANVVTDVRQGIESLQPITQMNEEQKRRLSDAMGYTITIEDKGTEVEIEIAHQKTDAGDDHPAFSYKGILLKTGDLCTELNSLPKAIDHLYANDSANWDPTRSSLLSIASRVNALHTDTDVRIDTETVIIEKNVYPDLKISRKQAIEYTKKYALRVETDSSKIRLFKEDETVGEINYEYIPSSTTPAEHNMRYTVKDASYLPVAQYLYREFLFSKMNPSSHEIEYFLEELSS